MDNEVENELLLEEDEELELTQDDAWAIARAYFDGNNFACHQIESYERFIKTMKEIIEKTEINIESECQHHPDSQSRSSKTIAKVYFRKMHIREPQFIEADGECRDLLPVEARLRNLTYSAPMYVTIEKNFVNKGANGEVNETDEITDIYLGKVPVMVQSTLCRLHKKSYKDLIYLRESPYDLGGYFVVDGTERVIIGQERLMNNHVYVSKKSGKYVYVAEIRSVEESTSMPSSAVFVGMLSRTSSKGGSSGQCIRATLPRIRTAIPICIVFRALGIASDKDILELICYDLLDTEMVELLKPSLEEAYPINTQQLALDYIGKRGATIGEPKQKRIEYAKDVLHRKVLPHVSTDEFGERDKAYFFGHMIRHVLLCALDRRTVDDKNHFGKKRVDLVGPLLEEIFRKLFGSLCRTMKAHAQKLIDHGKNFNLQDAINGGQITRGFNFALATGNWSKTNDNFERTGVSQVLNRLTYLSYLSHLRRLTSPFKDAVNWTKPRELHPTQWGMMCPAETPEGHACGLVKNLGLMVRISLGSKEDAARNLLRRNGLEEFNEITPAFISKATKIFLNGRWLGIHRDPNMLLEPLKKLKTKDYDKGEIAVVRDIRSKELRIYTDKGRCTRPLLKVQKLKLLMKKQDIDSLKQMETSQNKWTYLMSQGFVEYIDVEEEENTMISMFINDLVKARKNPEEAYSDAYTHCEIHPSLILGVCASIIPFLNHNQSPRNTFQCAMSKQAIGSYFSNHHYRMDTTAHFLHYPEKPLVATRAMEHIRLNESPTGANAIVAIASYEFNQGDAIIMNQSSIDRGLFRSTSYRSYSDWERKMGTLVKEEFGHPNQADTMAMLALRGYDKLENDGFVSPGTKVSGGDVIVGKTTLISTDEAQGQSHYKRRDCSLESRHNETGIVDQVLLSTNAEGLRMVKVKTRSTRTPQIGDKFTSRHGQKGVVGMTYRQEDLPWTIRGITPDIIINPHSFPSRMTSGQLLESLMGKVTLIGKEQGDATPFSEVTAFTEKYQKLEKEPMYTGDTGKKLHERITIGPTYYHRLRHMVDDKIHSRARGKMERLTRQPTQGRSRGGGLRFGEMERDCLISHGAASLLKERLCDQSDAHRVHICKQCGLLATFNVKRVALECNNCRNITDIVQVVMPYAFKLLVQELMTMCISPRMSMEENSKGDSATL